MNRLPTYSIDLNLQTMYGLAVKFLFCINENICRKRNRIQYQS